MKTYSMSSMYRFMGTCEHVATSLCESVPGFDVQVTVDFLTESMENGAVGLHVDDVCYVSRETVHLTMVNRLRHHLLHHIVSMRPHHPLRLRIRWPRRSLAGRWFTRAHSDDRSIYGRWLDIQTTNHSPSSRVRTLTIDGWTFKPPTTHHRAAVTHLRSPVDG